MEDSIREEIEQLKREKGVVVLAHYYVDGKVQALADFVGDSYFLAKKSNRDNREKYFILGCIFYGGECENP